MNRDGRTGWKHRSGSPGSPDPRPTPLSAELHIPASAGAALRAHLEAAYPDEGLAALVGEWDFASGRRVVREVVPLRNAAEPALRRRRCDADPAELLALFRREDEPGRTVVGFAHSHPDAAPLPSATDHAETPPEYALLLVSVVGGCAREARAWVRGWGEGDRLQPLALREG